MPKPEEVRDVRIEHVSYGNGVGYAIVANGAWIGTIHGAAGRAFRNAFVALPSTEANDFLISVAKRMAALVSDGLTSLAATTIPFN